MDAGIPWDEFQILATKDDDTAAVDVPKIAGPVNSIAGNEVPHFQNYCVWCALLEQLTFGSGCSGEGGGPVAQDVRAPPQCKVSSNWLRSLSPVFKKLQSTNTGLGPGGPRTSAS